jgi:hypothetical protein
MSDPTDRGVDTIDLELRLLAAVRHDTRARRAANDRRG